MLLADVSQFLDGSPVNAIEIQGVVIEIHRDDGDISTIILLGLSLMYGMMGIVDKAVVFLWAVASRWPIQEDLRHNYVGLPLHINVALDSFEIETQCKIGSKLLLFL